MDFELLSTEFVACSKLNQNQIFPYTRCITPKRVTSWRGQLRLIASGQLSFFRRNVARWRTVGNTVFDLTGPRFEPQTSCSRDEGVSPRPKQNKNNDRKAYYVNVGINLRSRIRPAQLGFSSFFPVHFLNHLL